MKYCKNHASKPARAKGLCPSCYMKERRLNASNRTRRAKNGKHYAGVLATSKNWIGRFNEMILPINENGCQEWSGTKNNGGYGVFYIKEKTLLAHRLSFMMHGGRHNAQVVMHKCDNPSCVNPDHLLEGTYKSNLEDMYSKGRRNLHDAPQGIHLMDRETHPRGKPVLTPKGQYASAALAADAFGISKRTAAKKAQHKDDGWSYL